MCWGSKELSLLQKVAHKGVDPPREPKRDKVVKEMIKPLVLP